MRGFVLMCMCVRGDRTAARHHLRRAAERPKVRDGDRDGRRRPKSAGHGRPRADERRGEQREECGSFGRRTKSGPG